MCGMDNTGLSRLSGLFTDVFNPLNSGLKYGHTLLSKCHQTIEIFGYIL